MDRLYVKKRSLYSFYHLCTKVIEEAQFRIEMCEDYLSSSSHSEDEEWYIKKVEKEYVEAKKVVEEYDEFLLELNDVEKLIVYSPKAPSTELNGIGLERFKIIRNEVVKKWCKKFLPSGIIYIHEIDKKKFGLKLKEVRMSRGFSAYQVTNLLCISESSLRNYEYGLRLPSINVLYALS